ncbi:MAG: cytochrome b/b6 domain-containing protein [Pseudomonadota bacterium]|nr:cytochrome b/b6 domain-containing protein [Pseudomonadota bacterium]
MPATVRVWDPLVRVFHWSLVASFAVTWIAAEEWYSLHEVAGYVAAGLVAFRLLWGLVGSRHARFARFVRSPSTVRAYLREVRQGREARYLGHNPAGGAMIVALLLSMAGLALTGWLYTLDPFWGSPVLEGLHAFLANLMLALVALHVGGVVLASVRHGENLVRAMVNGRKRAAEAGDID